MIHDLVVSCFNTTLAFDFRLSEPGANVAADGLRDEWVDAAARALRLSFFQLLRTLNAEDLIAGTDDAGLRFEDQALTDDANEAFFFVVRRIDKLG